MVSAHDPNGESNYDMLCEISGDISRTIKDHLGKFKNSLKSIKVPHTKKKQSRAYGSMEGNLTAIITKVIRALQPILVKCVSVKVCKAASSTAKQVKEVKRQCIDNSVIVDLKN